MRSSRPSHLPTWYSIGRIYAVTPKGIVISEGAWGLNRTDDIHLAGGPTQRVDLGVGDVA